MAAGKFVPSPVPDFDHSENFEECDHDCTSCERQYDSSIIKTIEMNQPLYGGIAPFCAHSKTLFFDVRPEHNSVVGVLTGRTDWVHEVTQEENSLAQRTYRAIEDKSEQFVDRDRVVLTNISLPPSDRSSANSGSEFDIMIVKLTQLTVKGSYCLVHIFCT